MKSFIILSILSLLSFVFLVYCKKDPIPVPACIQQKIDSIKGTPKKAPPVQVHAWAYEGRQVYLFTASCCNERVKVFDENCKYVCSPSEGDSLCIDFYQTAKYLGLIFRDDR